MLSTEQRIQNKQQLKDWLEYELSNYSKPKFEFLKLTEPAILRHFHKMLRKAEYHRNTGNKVLAKWYYVRLLKMEYRYGLHISLNTCAKGLRIMHLGSVIVNNSATVGEYCTFYPNTAVVAGGTKPGAPTLKKRVTLGIGAVVLGNITVAEYVAVGANAVVNKDVTESNISVAGVPAKKISNNNSVEWEK